MDSVSPGIFPHGFPKAVPPSGDEAVKSAIYELQWRALLLLANGLITLWKWTLLPCSGLTSLHAPLVLRQPEKNVNFNEEIILINWRNNGAFVPLFP